MSTIKKYKDYTNKYVLIREEQGNQEIIHIGYPVFCTNKNRLCAGLGGLLGSWYTKEDLKQILKAIDIEEKRRNID